MPSSPSPRRSAPFVLGALIACVLPTPGLGAQDPGVAVCPPETGRLVAAGWTAYRGGSGAEAEEAFRAALALCPREQDARIGLGFTLLQAEDVDEAEALFTEVVRVVPGSADAWEGSALVRQRKGDLSGAVEAWRRVLEIDPSRSDVRATLERIAPDWDQPTDPLPRIRAAELDLTLRVAGEGFELRTPRGWEPFTMKGVNMGMALPGRFPSEFPRDEALYGRWLRQISDMNANTVRLYTILPPEFYRALRDHNLDRPDRPLHIVHGVWTELPPDDDFDDAAFNEAYRKEIRDVMDLLHGSAVIAPAPGKASGRYDADVSPWTIGYIMGREWEPYSAEIFNELAGGPRSYRGEYLVIEDATATDVWMVEQADHLVDYEMETYNAQRPMAYTNWPTTDPIFHPTETSYDQEMEFRGLVYDRDPSLGPPHEEEGVSLDPSLATPTDALVAGWFASYHVYPYYPDFMLYDPGYNAGRSSFGRSNYFAYLQDLRAAHAGIPLVISEFGIPTSRGNAHSQPQGWDHGGVDEQSAAEMIVRLDAEIREAGAAGAIVFAWIDEWFKRNWFSADFEIPAERGRLWHNILSPEQHYGIVALRPGAPGTVPLPGGDATPWTSLPVYATGALVGDTESTLRVGSDEGHLYLALETPGLRGMDFPWDSTSLQLAIDTHLPEVGQQILPISGQRSAVGFEFLIQLDGPEAGQLQVIPEYNPYTPRRLALSGAYFGDHFRRPIRTVTRSDGVFEPLWALTNRPRYTDRGELIQGQGYDMGELRYGRAQESSLADWWYDRPTGTLQVRIPWLLLNVSDPSSGQVLTESVGGAANPDAPVGPGSELTSHGTGGLSFGVVALSPAPAIQGTIPARDPYGNWLLDAFPRYRWPGWEEPTWHEYLKPTYEALQRHWGGR